MAFTENMATRTSISGAAISQFTFVAGPASDGQINPAAMALVLVVLLCRLLRLLVKLSPLPMMAV